MVFGKRANFNICMANPKMSGLAGTLSALSLTAVALGASSSALADPDACIAGGLIVTCTGDQSDGAFFALTSSLNLTFNVENLTLPIAPPVNVSGVVFALTGVNGVDKIEPANIDDINGGIAFNGGDLIVDFEGAIDVSGTFAAGIWAQSTGGVGGKGGFLAFNWGDGGTGGRGGRVDVFTDPAITTFTDETGTLTSKVGRIDTDVSVGSGILAYSIGGAGGIAAGVGGKGGWGGLGGVVNIVNNVPITVTNEGSAIEGHSIGGAGGSGNGGEGGDGGDGGVVVIENKATLSSTSTGSAVIYASSIGGEGANRGGKGGLARLVKVKNSGDIEADGVAILMQSIGGQGGDNAAEGVDAAGRWGGEIIFEGSAADIRTSGVGAHAVYGLSEGGSGGDGLDGDDDAPGADGGYGGNILFTDNSTIHTYLDYSAGLVAQSNGGKGGEGARGDNVDAVGGDGGDGGHGGEITIVQNKFSYMNAKHSPGIFAESLGGAGALGGFAGGLSSTPGDGGKGGDAGRVTIDLYGGINTANIDSPGIIGRSIGGVGAAGGEGIGLGGGGGDGQSGGQGSTVFVSDYGGIFTSQARSMGVVAQSIGGGGGNGGGLFAVYGGSGGDGAGAADAGAAIIYLFGENETRDPDYVPSVRTWGDGSHGLMAQSIGGNGGYGTATDFSAFVDIAGDGGAGSNGATAFVSSAGTISTLGDQAHGILAESLGGGGGDGATGDGLVGLGGDAQSSGNGFNSIIVNSGSISVTGTESIGAMALSIGGGGGNANIGGSGGLVAVGGDGGAASHGGLVQVVNLGSIETFDGSGIHAESLGGGGGQANSTYGWFVVGGEGGGGGNGGLVEVDHAGSIIAGNASSAAEEEDEDAHVNAIFASSVGGGGGTVDSTVAVGAFLSMAVGGNGGGAGNGGEVNVNVTPSVRLSDVEEIKVDNAFGGGMFVDDILTQTTGNIAPAILAQSIGGGGGKTGLTASFSGGAYVSSSVAVGGSGAGGGHGSAVNVEVSGQVFTSGDVSPGIIAESIGGGGGTSGGTLAGAIAAGQVAATFSTAIGGSGGAGGDGDVVNVRLDDRGYVETLGHGSHGIFAQSVGGGGGSTGFTGNVSISVGKASGSVSQTVGGTGGDGGNGADVTVLNEGGDIYTRGIRAYGMLGQSIGDGGGDAGLTFAGAVAISGSGSGNVSSTVGGSGGGGGDGGEVRVVNEGRIRTEGILGIGVYGESIGGGGGNAGITGAINISSSKSLNYNAVIGGDGGDGASGNNVTVLNTRWIQTEGDLAHGLFGHSVGGGGGSGALTGALTATGGSSVNLGFAAGGSGGTGNIGGYVIGSNEGYLETFGEAAYGVFAESLGGGGGHGGYAGAMTLSYGAKAMNFTGALGGDGGTGNVGGNVFVQNLDEIYTHGNFSPGLYGHSVGGGGGNGGHALSATLALNESGNMNVEYTLGGTGGTGNNSGMARGRNEGLIETFGGGSQGIYVQSVAGGGGHGGSSLTWFKDGRASDAKKNSVNVIVAIGGKGGNGGTPDLVQVKNYGQIITHGAYSEGVFAQSVAGGGGNGGNADANLSELIAVGIEMGLDEVSQGLQGKISAKVTQAVEEPEKAKTLKVGIAIGGSGGTGGVGGLVTVLNEDLILTEGTGSTAIYAQSVGGGGGRGGNGSSGYNGTVSLGGQGGSANDGGVVDVTNDGSIAVGGELAHGIFAQSVGAGGGDGGHAAFGSAVGVTKDLLTDSISKGGLNVKKGAKSQAKKKTQVNIGISVGGSAGASGHGGDVSVVTEAGSSIVLTGDSGMAIFAQSIGAGGGNGGQGSWGMTGQIGIGGEGGAAGNGGTIVVDNGGSISTSGAGDFGIFAQSVGGGGGTAGDINFVVDNFGTVQDFQSAVGDVGTDFDINLGDGNSGDGGDIIVINTNNIEVRGVAGFGILAQSVGGGGGIISLSGIDTTDVMAYAGSTGGEGDGGRIEITSNGLVVATGDYGVGIFAQSVGTSDFRADTISIKQTGGVILGGDYDGWGIIVDQGTTNTIELTGSHVGAFSGNAIKGTVGNENVINKGGTIDGNIDLGSGFNTVANFESGHLYTGNYLSVGGGVVTNLGVISPGRKGIAQTTTITSGIFALSDTSNLEFDAWFGNGASDLLSFSGGTATLGGDLTINLLALEDSNATVTVIEGGAIINNFATSPFTIVDDSQLLNYTLSYSPVSVTLGVSVDVDGLSDLGLTDTQDDLIDYIVTSLDEGSPALGTLVADLGTIADPDDLQATMDTLSGQIYSAGIGSGPALPGGFSGGFFSCETAGPGASWHGAEGDCIWMRVTGFSTDQDRVHDNSGMKEDGSGISIGFQREMKNDWHVGLSIGTEEADLRVGSASTSEAERYMAGLSLKYFGETYRVTGVLSGGVHKLDNKRQIVLPSLSTSATSQGKMHTVSSRLRVERIVDRDGFYLAPMVDLGASYVAMDGLHETGAGVLNLLTDDARKAYATLTPSLEIGTDTTSLTGRRNSAYIRSGIELSSDRTFVVDARLEGGSATPFEIRNEYRQVAGIVDAGLELSFNDRISLKVNYEGRLNSEYESHSLGAKLRASF